MKKNFNLQPIKLAVLTGIVAAPTFAAPPPWQLGPVSGQLCASLDAILAGEIMNISTLAGFKNKEIDADKAMNLLMQTQQYIQQRHVDSARQAIAQVNMETGDRAFAAVLLPQLLTVYQKCDLWISRFTMSKPENISDADYSTMEDYCKVQPQKLYKSYCIPPEGKQCTEKAVQKGKEVWLKFKIKVGDELCKQLLVVNTMVQERLIDPQLTPCDDEFNVALVKHIEEHVEQVKAKCPPPPVVVSLETCAKDGNKAGKEAWNEFKDNAGYNLCGKLANSDDLIKENSRSDDTDCDESFNEKLTAYLEKRINKAKDKCASTPKPTTPNTSQPEPEPQASTQTPTPELKVEVLSHDVQQQPVQKSSQTYMIKDKNSSLCWHVRGASTEQRADIITWDCRSDLNHFKFEFIPTNSNSYPNTYYIRDRNSGQCLHVQNASTEARSPLWTWNCDDIIGKDVPHAMFKKISAGDGYVFIQAANADNCMHVRGASHEIRAEIWTWPCAGVTNADHAKFELIPVE